MRQRSVLSAAVAGVVLSLVPAVPGRAADASQYEGRARGSVMSFTFHVPQIVPLTIIGGAFDSTVLANSLPQGFATAGVFPVPAASSAGVLIPTDIPQLGMPVPKEIREAFKSFDYTNTPNYCQAVFPPSKEGLDEAFCGGPAQRDPALGFTSATTNGHAKANGKLDDPLETKALAESRGQDVTMPAFQATFRNASSNAVSGLNGDRIPQSQSRAEAKEIELLGGAVKLGDLLSETTVVNDGTAEGSAGKTIFSLGSASIFGVPIRIGPDGFTVVSPDAPHPDPKALTEAVNKSASIQGFSLRLFPAPPLKTENGLVTAESGGIEVSYTTDTPISAHVVQRYGYTWASVTALPGESTPAAAESELPTVDGGSGPVESPSAQPTTDIVARAPGALSLPAPSSAVEAPAIALPTGATAMPSGPLGDVPPEVAAITTSAGGDPAFLAGSLLPTGAFRPGRLRGTYLALSVFLFGAPLIFRLRRAAR